MKNSVNYELELESQLVEALIKEPNHDYVARGLVDELGYKNWKYRKEIKTTVQLWENFKRILELHNQETLQGKQLSGQEFGQVKSQIEALRTPYLAGQFLYGYNGVSQVEIDLDDNRHVFLTIFRQDNIGAGDNVYQVVTQIEREAKIAGKQSRRFDTTLLINGLPIIQIEEKAGSHDADEALNQMKMYAQERQYTDIFSTLQILVAMTPTNVKYMANVEANKFSLEFAFRWQDEKTDKPVFDWRTFTRHFLSIPMAHQMATNYMILDGTKNKQTLKVMRPYQVYATQRIIDKVKKHDFSMGDKRLGYIWHTTGSGKTISSFKTAWLASRLPNVDKVVFLVDRIALTNQTVESYSAYDPDTDEMNQSGVVTDTANISELSRKLKSKDNRIIVTSIQKMDRLVQRKAFKALQKNIIFIMDEAHRTADDNGMIGRIKEAFKFSAFVGYTGTPMFQDMKDEKSTTEAIFGKLLHAYTIKEAIADKNVLGFQVDFKNTLPDDYEEQLKQLTSEEDYDDNLKSGFYDNNPKHVKEVVKDIFDNWLNRSKEGKYNALFTTHVGGNRPSTPMAMMYWKEFQAQNEKRPEQERLKVAVTFSQDNTNGKSALTTNEDLHTAINAYNALFGTTFDMSQTKAYTAEVAERLAKKSIDGNYLDIVIVIDQLLTGFDAPELNTLYVDRTLKGSSLIQAYSRTNRVQNQQLKPWGRIINYRWPEQNELEMNKALGIYSNPDSANVQLSLDEWRDENEENGLLQKSFVEVVSETKKTLERLKKLTDELTELPKRVENQEEMIDLLRKYSRELEQLKSFDYDADKDEGYDYKQPERIFDKIGLTEQDHQLLTVTFKNELIKEKASREDKPIDVVRFDLDLVMTQVKEITVNYEYLDDLLKELLNASYVKDQPRTEKARTAVHEFATSLENRKFAENLESTADEIVKGERFGLEHPIGEGFHARDLVEKAVKQTSRRTINDFRKKWGLLDEKIETLKTLLENHVKFEQDLDKHGELSKIVNQGAESFKDSADEEIAKLSKIKYRNEVRKALYELADSLK